MKKILLLSLVLISTNSVHAEEFSKLRLAGIASTAALGPLAYCAYKAGTGSKTAKTIMKGFAIGIYAAATITGAILFTNERFDGTDKLLFLSMSGISGLITCVCANEFINDLKEANQAT